MDNSCIEILALDAKGFCTQKPAFFNAKYLPIAKNGNLFTTSQKHNHCILGV